MKFLRQDYYKYRRLKRKWRRPKGRHSKLRVRKGGSGKKVSIGYGKMEKARPVLINDLNSLNDFKGNAIIISSQVGSKKTIAIANKAKKAGIKILNMKKVKKAQKKEKLLTAKAEKKKEEKKEEKAEKKKEKKTVKEKKAKEEKEPPTLVDKNKAVKEKKEKEPSALVEKK